MADNTMEGAIVKLLLAESTITDICSTRIYPMKAPQSAALPHMTMQQISANRDHVMDGPSGLAMNRFQFNCWATTYGGAKRLFEALRIYFDGYTGTVNSRQIQCVQSDNEGDMLGQKPGTEVIDRYGKRLDFIISFQEPTS